MMSGADDFEPDDATPAECLRKAASLRLMASMLDPGVSQRRALALAETWERKARERVEQNGSDGKA
jgi:hypothetical protein